MLKKLVALTLAALMLINPMTAFAVTWSSVVDTLYVQRYYNENGVDAKVDDAGNVTVSAGTITDFYTDNRFASYTFMGSVVIDGETFEVHVGESDAVLVNIESGVGVQVDKVSISTGSGAVAEVNNSGSIEADKMFVSAGADGEVVVMNTADGVIVVEDELGLFAGYEEDDEEAEGPGEATLEFVNAGSVTAENLWAWSHEGGSVTIDNDGGTISMEVGEHENPEEDEQPGPGELNLMADGSGNLTLENGGAINGDVAVNMGWEDDSPAATGTATVTNDGTVNGDVNANLHDEANATVTNNETVNGAINARGWDTSSVEATNSGTADMLYADVGGDATVKTTNTETGTVGQQHSDVNGNGTLYQTNDGTVTEQFTSEVNGGNAYNTNNGTIEGFVGTNVRGEGSAEVTNNGTVTDAIDVGSYGGGTADIVNDGTAENIYSGAFDGGTTTVTNNNTVNNELVVDTNNGTLEVTNEGTVGGQMDVWAFGEEGSATATNNGTVGSSEDGNGVWAEAGEGGTVELTNDGTINGEIGGAATEGSTTTINNNGSAESAWINAHGGDVALNNEGAVKGTLSVSIGTQSNAVTDTETVAELLKQTGIDISGYENVDIYTANQDGELIARYSVAADGTVVLEEVLMEQGGDGDDPRFWTKERIRHDKEEERKAAEIGGVFGSPYWLKQLYLGYMSLNLRLFDGEEQLLFKESVSWVPYTGKLGEKVLTLNAKIEDTANLTMRLDGAVIDKLEQAGIVTINIVDGAGNLFMEYKVEDLKGAREMYGLTAKEYIVVGAADADVMKIAEDGTISPIEGEAEPAEEVAEEPKAEAEEAAAEENTAA